MVAAKIKNYVPVKVTLLEIAGVEHSIRAMRLPKMSTGDSHYVAGGQYKLGNDNPCLATLHQRGFW